MAALGRFQKMVAMLLLLFALHAQDVIGANDVAGMQVKHAAGRSHAQMQEQVQGQVQVDQRVVARAQQQAMAKAASLFGIVVFGTAAVSVALCSGHSKGKETQRLLPGQVVKV
eukprot:TRINITY_DN2172_c0_g1_i1.p2 TRINITY_DN2172_c0_g1~~TRINITY_DN2172_c0_g1_i1.p2  ORF type:complete len:113 (+),score=31.01 TRINITY_DN2172_c0_g1_i1:173-511(+)